MTSIPQLFHASPKRTRTVVLVFLAVEIMLLSWLSTLGAIPVGKLFVGYGIAFISYLAVVLFVLRFKNPFPLWFWLIAALVIRIPWLASGLSLSDDAWRYLHDGRAQVAGVNPYRYAPQSPEASAYAGPEHHLINNPELPTIYPPVAQLVFRSAIHLGGTLKTWKMLLLLFDLGIGLAIARILVTRGQPSSRAAIYLLHPLPIVEFAGNGHVDAIAIFALMLALAWADRRPLTAGASLACSVAAKYLALPLAPFFLRNLPPKRGAALALGGLATLVVVYLPFFNYPPLGSLGQFAQTFEFNGPVYNFIALFVSPLAVRFILGTSLLIVLVTAWLLKLELADAALVWISAILLLSPIVHPWYVVWLIPFLALRVEGWALVWSGTVVFSYAVLTEWRSAEIWDLPTWALGMEYIPVYGLLVWRLWAGIRGQRSEVRGEKPLPWPLTPGP